MTTQIIEVISRSRTRRSLTLLFSGAVSGIERNDENGAARPPLQRLVRPTFGKDGSLLLPQELNAVACEDRGYAY
jgi:hypothetical protein